VIARIQKSMKEKDQGFTLIELLVVMIIIGILAAIAIPIFLNQRKKANDTAGTSDVSTLGKEIATYYVDATAVLAASNVSATSGASLTVVNPVGNASTTTTGAVLTYPGAAGSATVTAASTSWCVALSYSSGTRSVVYYSAEHGLKTSGC
jgi:type IV pilus assembly protein PilA